jgi:predicted TIM-barrel fold metal-dependent hydrolase
VSDADDIPTFERPLIVDAHCHIASTKYTPESFIWGAVANTSQLTESQKRRAGDLYLKRMQDHLCDELVGEMDAAGIAKSILLCADFTHALKDCQLTIEEMIRDHATVARRHPGRFFVFAGVDPRWGKDGVDLFERSVSRGDCHGFKVYPPCGFGPSDPLLYPYYEICSKYSLPVTVHIGPTSSVLAFDNGRPELIDKAARDFPKVSFILAHGSTYYVQECIMMCAYRPNVYLDVSAFESGSPEDLRAMFRKGINRKILFGTDFPVFRMGGRQVDFIDPLLGDDGPLNELNEDDLERVMSGNVLRLLPEIAEAESAGSDQKVAS